MKTVIMGHTIEFDPATAESGHYYLSRELDDDERRVFFDQAYNKGFAVFEDHLGSKFKLVHHGGEYQLVKA